jgi:hypothetical protein
MHEYHESAFMGAITALSYRFGEPPAGRPMGADNPGIRTNPIGRPVPCSK